MHLVALVGFLFFEAAAACLWAGMRSTRRYVAVTATILESRLDVSERTVGIRTSTIYRPRIRCSYEFAGQHYECSELGIGAASVEGLKAAVARHPRGAVIHAWVDPKRPAEAVLERSSPWNWFPLAFAVGGLLWLGIWEALAAVNARG